MGAVLVAAGLMLYGLLGMIVIPFRESVPCGLMNLFVPFYGVYYLVTRQDAMKGAFLANVSGIGILIVMAVMLPAVSSARRAAQGAVASNEQAAAEPLNRSSTGGRTSTGLRAWDAPGFPWPPTRFRRLGLLRVSGAPDLFLREYKGRGHCPLGCSPRP